MVKITVEADLCLNFVPGQQIIAQVLRQRQPCLYGLLGSVLCLSGFYIFQLSQDARTFCPILHWGTRVPLLHPTSFSHK